jgi:hypothetical protein
VTRLRSGLSSAIRSIHPRSSSAKGEQDEKADDHFIRDGLLMSAVAVAQYEAQQPDNSKSGTSMKAVSITGKISDDGKMFVSDKDSKSWAISKTSDRSRKMIFPIGLRAFPAA